MTACVISDDRESLYASIYIHGRNILQETPEHLEVAAVLHGLRALEGWLGRTQKENRTYKAVNLRAGSFAAIKAIGNWMSQGTLTKLPLLASPLIEDIDRMEDWLEEPLRMRPLETPTIMGAAQTLP